MNRLRFAGLALPLVAWAFSGCAINYETNIDNSATVPEFVLENASVTRWEDSTLRVMASAAMVEQYKSQDVYYARDVSCEIYDEAGELQTVGAFGFVSADTKEELYTLHGNINIENRAEETSVRAQSIIWSGNTGLLASAENDSVTISKSGSTPFSFTGKGFQADTFNRAFRFLNVSGTIVSGEIDEIIEDGEAE
jgi:hypothetical protein